MHIDMSFDDEIFIRQFIPKNTEINQEQLDMLIAIAPGVRGFIQRIQCTPMNSEMKIMIKNRHTTDVTRSGFTSGANTLKDT